MIAAELLMSVWTVHTHIESIYAQPQVSSKSEAVAMALHNRMV